MFHGDVTELNESLELTFMIAQQPLLNKGKMIISGVDDDLVVFSVFDSLFGKWRFLFFFV